MIKRTAIFFILLFCATFSASAQQSKKISYAWGEEWYWQLSGGANYLLADNTRYKSLGELLSWQTSFALGKYFNPVWSAELRVLFGNNKGVYYPIANSDTFDFRHTSVNLLGAMNISQLMAAKRGYDLNKKWNWLVKFGVGLTYTDFGNTKSNPGSGLDRNNKAYPSLLLGTAVFRRLSRNWDLTAEINTTWMNEAYNGQKSVKSGIKMDGVANLILGVRYKFFRSKYNKKGYNGYGVKTANAVIREAIVREPKTEFVFRHDTVKVERVMRMMPAYYSLEDLLDIVYVGKKISGKRMSVNEKLVFVRGTTGLKPHQQIYLDKVIELLKHSDASLVIRGYRDDTKSPKYDHLTEKRMDVVSNYITKQGISRHRLIYQWIMNSENPFLEDNQEQTVEFEVVSFE